MPDHVITVLAHWQGHGLWLSCTCVNGKTFQYLPGASSLVDVNEVAHSHIETGNRDPEYGARSAATTGFASSPES